jgi:carbon storage regulator
MLVLSRKVGERIRIGDSVVITVVRVTGGGVRLGIEAPAELPVVREELHQALLKQDQAEQSATQEGTDQVSQRTDS